jgi:hypothetical protein
MMLFDILPDAGGETAGQARCFMLIRQALYSWAVIGAAFLQKIRRLFTFTLVTRTDTLKSILLGQSVIIMGLLKTFQEPPFMQRG